MTASSKVLDSWCHCVKTEKLTSSSVRLRPQACNGHPFTGIKTRDHMHVIVCPNSLPSQTRFPWLSSITAPGVLTPLPRGAMKRYPGSTEPDMGWTKLSVGLGRSACRRVAPANLGRTLGTRSSCSSVWGSRPSPPSCILRSDYSLAAHER